MALKRTCTASQLMARLQQFVAEYGDLPVYADDADTGWILPIGLRYSPAHDWDEQPERFEITTSYSDRPDGDLA